MTQSNKSGQFGKAVTRRRFVRRAVQGGAAVVGVGGLAGVGLAACAPAGAPAAQPSIQEGEVGL